MILLGIWIGIRFVYLPFKFLKRMTKEVQIYPNENKYRNLILGIIFDGIGMLSFVIPLIGEFSDVVWAPIAAYLLTKMYKGRIGKIGGVIEFVGQILPFSDVVPTFTLTWIYYYLIRKKKIKY